MFRLSAFAVRRGARNIAAAVRRGHWRNLGVTPAYNIVWGAITNEDRLPIGRSRSCDKEAIGIESPLHVLATVVGIEIKATRRVPFKAPQRRASWEELKRTIGVRRRVRQTCRTITANAVADQNVCAKIQPLCEERNARVRAYTTAAAFDVKAPRADAPLGSCAFGNARARKKRPTPKSSK